MPDATIVEVPQETRLATDIAAKTTAAVADTGFGADFDAEVEAAIARDTGAPPPKPEVKAPAPKEQAKDTPKPKEQPKGLDIPEALLTKKDKTAEAPKGELLDPEREKFIKENTAGMSTKAADRFRAIEAKAWAAEQKALKAEKLERELNETREKMKNAVDSSALEALKKDYEELDGIVQKQAIADHPRFKARYDAQIAKEVGIAAKLVPAEAASEVEALLSLPETAQRNRRLNEISGEMDDVAATKFRNAIDRHDRLAEERNGELANWKVNKAKLAELSEQEKSEAMAHRQRSIESALKSVIPRFTDEEKGVEIFRKVDGNDDWNKSVDARLEQVKKLTEADLGREDIAEMAAWAMSGQEYRKLFLTQRVLVNKLQEEIAALKGGEPSLGDGNMAAGSDDDEKGSMIDAVSRMAQKMGIVR